MKSDMKIGRLETEESHIVFWSGSSKTLYMFRADIAMS